MNPALPLAILWALMIICAWRMTRRPVHVGPFRPLLRPRLRRLLPAQDRTLGPLFSGGPR